MNTQKKTFDSDTTNVGFTVPIQSIIIFDSKVCTGCPTLREPMCIKACRTDMLMPNPQKGMPPIVAFPDECCECGCCVHACPRAFKGAISMNWPLSKSVRWKRKSTGLHYRVRMPNPPAPNTRPPVSGYYPK